MLVKHITDFMQEQLRSNKSHQIYLVKGQRTVEENGREVKYYDIREANLLEKAKFNLPTESSLRARANANIELACALEEMRQQEFIARMNGEYEHEQNFTMMGNQRLSSSHFANMTVDPMERTAKLTGRDLSTMTDDQWQRFKKIDKFLHFVQQERHVPGNLGENTSMSGMSTASGRANWSDAIRTGEAWRLFVIRNDEQHRATEREVYRNTSVSLKDDLTISSVFSHVSDAGGMLDIAEEQRLERLVPDTATRRGRSAATSKDDVKAANMARKRAVLEFEDDIIKKKDLQADEKTRARPPAPLPKSASPSRVPTPPQTGCKIPDISQTADHIFSRATGNAHKIEDDGYFVPHYNPKKGSKEKLKESNEDVTDFRVTDGKQSPESTAPTAVVSAYIPHAIIDHVNAPVVDDGKPIVYASIEGAAPESKKPELPQELVVESPQVNYADIATKQSKPELIEEIYSDINKKKPITVVLTPVQPTAVEQTDLPASYATVNKPKKEAETAPPVPEETAKKLELKPAVPPKPVKPIRTGEASPEKVAEDMPPPVPKKKTPPTSPTKVESLIPRN